LVVPELPPDVDDEPLVVSHPATRSALAIRLAIVASLRRWVVIAVPLETSREEFMLGRERGGCNLASAEVRAPAGSGLLRRSALSAGTLDAREAGLPRPV
jgi:hypothetical protein